MAGTRPTIAVFGAGLIGVYLGGVAARAADVTLIGRASMLDPLREGLTISATGADRFDFAPGALRLASDGKALATADLVLVTTKSEGTAAAGKAIAAHARPDALVLSFQNGVENTAQLRELVGGRTVLGGIVPFNVRKLDPVHFHRSGGSLLLAEDHPALQPFAPLLRANGLSFQLVDDIVPRQWGKLLFNLNNAINALSGLPIAAEIRQRDFRRAWALSMDEALALLKAAGVQPLAPNGKPMDMLPQIFRLSNALFRFVMRETGQGLARVDAEARSSMSDDLALGRKTEIEYFQGELIRLAERLGRPAPVSERVRQLILAAERGASPLAAAELWRQVQEAHRAARPAARTA